MPSELRGVTLSRSLSRERHHHSNAHMGGKTNTLLGSRPWRVGSRVGVPDRWQYPPLEKGGKATVTLPRRKGVPYKDREES